jgi:hypothetical protein
LLDWFVSVVDIGYNKVVAIGSYSWLNVIFICNVGKVSNKFSF